jgi:non-ribosomal peptide synthetase component E (peptide arylation enzyme)
VSRENPTYLFSINATQLLAIAQYGEKNVEYAVDFLGTNVFYNNPSSNDIVIYHNGEKIFSTPYSNISNRSFDSAKEASDFVHQLILQGYMGLPAVTPGRHYEYPFSAAVSVTILGTQHLFGRKPTINVYDSTGQFILAGTNVDQTTFDVTITFNKTTTGYIILT